MRISPYFTDSTGNIVAVRSSCSFRRVRSQDSSGCGARTLACSVATPRDARSVCTLRASSELDAARMSACATTAYAQLFLRRALAAGRQNELHLRIRRDAGESDFMVVAEAAEPVALDG